MAWGSASGSAASRGARSPAAGLGDVLLVAPSRPGDAPDRALLRLLQPHVAEALAWPHAAALGNGKLSAADTPPQRNEPDIACADGQKGTCNNKVDFESDGTEDNQEAGLAGINVNGAPIVEQGFAGAAVAYPASGIASRLAQPAMQ
mmetsp:Transcript_72679/g.126193  ORF Transcript_72679/g.126193 Transcript_72679/m.126193 type:complete len:147 (+) Transcript_72679:170-610(+)